MDEPTTSDRRRTRWCTSICCPNTPCLRRRAAEATSYSWTSFRAFMRRQQKRLLKYGTVDSELAGSLDEFTRIVVTDIGFPASLTQRIIIVGEPRTAEDLLHVRVGALAWWPTQDHEA